MCCMQKFKVARMDLYGRMPLFAVGMKMVLNMLLKITNMVLNMLLRYEVFMKIKLKVCLRACHEGMWEDWRRSLATVCPVPPVPIE